MADTEAIPVDELCRDIQMKLPDALWQLDYCGRYMAGRFNEDFATDVRDGRTYLFGVVEVPLAYTEGVFTWGLWCEVSETDHNRYLEGFQTEAVDDVEIEGRIANDVPGYPDAMGARVRLALHSERRPEVTVLDGTLAQAQAKGLTLDEHRALDETLFGGPDEAGDSDFEDED